MVQIFLCSSSSVHRYFEMEYLLKRIFSTFKSIFLILSYFVASYDVKSANHQIVTPEPSREECRWTQSALQWCFCVTVAMLLYLAQFSLIV